MITRAHQLTCYYSQLAAVPDKEAKKQKLADTMNKKRVQGAALHRRMIFLYDVEDVLKNFQGSRCGSCSMLLLN